MLKYWIWLTTLPGLSVKAQRQVLEHFGSVEEAYLSDARAAAMVPGLSKREAERLSCKDLRLADQVLSDCEKEQISVLTFQDAAYPVRLRNIDDPPLVLYYKGRLLDFDELPAVAVVGSRSASGYGLTAAKRLGFQLGICGGTVVSGAARGIDSMALEGALSADAPVAGVLGCGLDIVYPASAKTLYADIAAHGTLLSEYVPGTAPLGRNFPRRNRLMSGLSLGVVVVEAPQKSGSLITAAHALEQGRDVFAVPGNIGLACCAGSNALIREGAALVTDGWDVLREYRHLYPKLQKRSGGKSVTLGPGDGPFVTGQTAQVASPTAQLVQDDFGGGKSPLQEKSIDKPGKRTYIDLQTPLTEDEQAIVTILRDGQKHVDDIILESGLPAARILASLTLLEVEGIVIQQPGKRFELRGS